MAAKNDYGALLQGTLDLLILRILSLEPMHAWGISERIRQVSGEVFGVRPGSLYPALERLSRRGWVSSQWSITDNNRRARFYSLTAAGRRQLSAEKYKWRRSAAAVERILDMA